MFPIIAALAQAGGIIIDKIVLTRRQVELKVFVPVLFMFLFLLTAMLAPFLAHVKIELLDLKYIMLFAAMIITAAIWNVFYYRGAQTEKVHEFEMIVMFQPLLTVILASMLLKGERNVQLELAAIVASVALILSHINKKHFQFSKGSWGLVVAVIFMSLELILIKLLLDVFSPVALYAVRTAILFVLFYFYYRPSLTRVANRNVGLILATSILGTIQMITKFYGFEKYGVIYTSLILISAPVLVYIISTIFLHERLKARTLFSTLVILACIVYVSIIGG